MKHLEIKDLCHGKNPAQSGLLLGVSGKAAQAGLLYQMRSLDIICKLRGQYHKKIVQGWI